MTRVVVSVGTDHHPFARLIGWIDEWAAANDGVEVWVQHGRTHAPTVAQGAPLVAIEDLLARVAAADVVVTHGGPATIMDVRSQGHRPLVVPRDPTHGEHVDNHQMLFADRMADKQLVTLITSKQQLHDELSRAVAQPDLHRIDHTDSDLDESIARFGSLVARLAPTDPSG